jgi:hypothetical protein
VKIYLCARYGRKDEMAGHAARLEAEGHDITSSWVHDPPSDSDFGLPEHANRHAHRDLDDLAMADAIICFTEPEGSPFSRGGRHVEWGFALAQEKRMIVIGPYENIFHTVQSYRFDDIDSLLAAHVNDPSFSPLSKATWGVGTGK